VWIIAEREGFNTLTDVAELPFPYSTVATTRRFRGGSFNENGAGNWNKISAAKIGLQSGQFLGIKAFRFAFLRIPEQRRIHRE
jgi:hypothetical protein